jgi:outer membrane autotransporter protein
MRRLLAFTLAFAALPVAAQTPTDALATAWAQVCATASVSGGLLLVRCTETATSVGAADLIAARGQRLEEIPGQARASTRESGGSQATGLQVRAGPALSMQGMAAGAMSLSLAYTGEGDDAGGGGGLAAPWGVFASVEGGRLDRETGPNEAGFDADTLHLTVGAERRVGARGNIGAAFNLDREDLDFTDSDGSAEADYRGLLAFGSVQLGDAWVLDAYAGSAHGSSDLRRRIQYSLARVGGGTYEIDELATADPDSRRRVFGLGADYAWSRGAWNGDVGFGVDWTRTTIDAYTESGGGGLALEVPGRRIETRRGRLDARFGRTVSTSWGVWQPSLRVGWRQEFGNERRRVTVQLANDRLDNPITFDTEDPDRGWGELALGSVFTFTHGHSGFLEYRQRFAHEFLQERIFAIGWRMELP